MKNIWIFCLGMAALSASADPDALFKEAEDLARGNQKSEAMAKAEAAAKELERMFAADENISWHGRNGLRFAAKLAREDFLDYDKALAFSDKLMALADGDYWRVPAHLDRALTFRAMGDHQRAQAEYDRIAQSTDEREKRAALLPHAEMVYFELEDRERGRELLLSACANPNVNARERVNTLKNCAAMALAKGNRKEALNWYAQIEDIPVEKEEERARFLSQAFYEMGKIEESLGNTAQARKHYQNAMALEAGEMRYRARARDALEAIQYFE